MLTHLYPVPAMPERVVVLGQGDWWDAALLEDGLFRASLEACIVHVK